MTDDSASSRPAGLSRRLLIAAVALVAVLVPAGLYLPDLGLRWGVVRGLTDLGWAQASVSQAKVSLLKGAVAIRGMQAVTALGEALGIDGIDLTFRWKPLLARRLWLEQLSFDKADIALTRTPDGWRVNGLPVPGGEAGAEPSPWGYGVTALTLTDSRLAVEDGPVRVIVEIERLELRDLASWVPLAPASLSFKGRVNGAPLSLSGTVAPFAERLDFALDLRVDGLDLAPFARWGGLAGGDGRLDAELRLEGGADGHAPIRAEGRLGLADGVQPLDGGKVAAARLDWQGRVDWRDGLIAVGTLEAADMVFVQGGARLAAEAARMRLDRASLDGKAERFDWKGMLSATGWALEMDGLSVRHQHLAWTGESQLNLSATATALFTAKGQADGSGTVVRFEDWRLEAAKSWAEGEFAHEPSRGILPPVAGTMTLKVEKLALRQGERDWVLAEHARVRDLSASAAGLRLGRLEASGVGMLGRGNSYGPRLRARALTLDKLLLTPAGDIEVAALALAQPVIRVNRDHTGIEGLNDFAKSGDKAAAAERRRFVLGRVRLAGGQVEFRDRSTRDPVRLSVRDLAVAVTGLDSARPEQDSPFSLTASVGDGAVAAQGVIRPFRPIPGLDAKGSVRALELPPLSPYAADALGVDLHTGQLDGHGALKVKDGILDGGMDLVLSRLRIAQPDPNAPLAKQADMPVETVLDLLRDGDDRITLSIPVRGDLDNPNFDTSDAVNQAIGGALRTTLFTTLKVAFPQVGLIGMVIDEAERPVLAQQSLDFAAGSAELTADGAQALDKVAALLAGRDGVRLNLCGVAVTAADGPVLRREASLIARLKAMLAEKDREELAEFERDRLRRLAEARAAAVKAWLVDKGGIDPGHLFTCRPRVDDTGKARPRVDLVL